MDGNIKGIALCVKEKVAIIITCELSVLKEGLSCNSALEG
jgi:hypothetical protein